MTGKGSKSVLIDTFLSNLLLSNYDTINVSRQNLAKVIQELILHWTFIFS